MDRPATVTIKDNANSVKASTTYTYDEGTPATLNNTPNHISISGSRGNLTTVASLDSDSLTLFHHLTYYDTGSVHTASDTGTTASVGPNLTTYTYPDATSTSAN